MKRSALYAAVVSIIAMLLLSATITPSQLAKPTGSLVRETPPIGAQTILFGDTEVTDDFRDVRAFIPTGSLSEHCLVTLSESNFAIPGITVFCGAREFQGQKGILVSAFFPEPIPAGLILSATVYQEHAHGYGEPVLFTGE